MSFKNESQNENADAQEKNHKASANVNCLTDHLFRNESKRMVSVLVKIFGTENLETAEDVVQETLGQALQLWKVKGIPDNPSAWLFQVARNKAIDIIRRNRKSEHYDFPDTDILLPGNFSDSGEFEMNDLWQDAQLEDDLLRMMFACCDPGIPQESQVAIILKTLCGFTIAEIAKTFLTNEETISKRIYRARQYFRENKTRLSLPSGREIKERSKIVLHCIYLMFNEGYNSTDGTQLIRRDVIEESIALCRILSENKNTQLPEVYALLALMSFHCARIDSRISAEGEIILLEHQNRSLWDKNLISQGSTFMNKAAFGDSISSYHLEAAIAFEHCAAESFETTNWKRILEYYDSLIRVNPSAVVMLNRIIVIYQLEGVAKALSEIEKSPYKKSWQDNYLFHSLLGELYTSSDKEKAREYFIRAASLTRSAVELNLLKRKIELIIKQ